ncbi:MAG: tetratricopeptide (TPR) repeat protein [Enterobacterales bacterium]|jgi:tetratricopeptide (TPR) repeat protein
MSLINKMLNDLEKRDAFLHEKQDAVIDGLYSAYDIELDPKKGWRSSTKAFVYILTAISITVILIHFYLNRNPSFQISALEINSIKNDTKSINSNDVLKVESQVSNEDSTSQGSESLLKLDDSLFIQTPYPVTETKEPDALNIIKEIFFDTNEQGINLVIKMPEDIDYLVYGLNNPNRIVIEVNNSELGFLLEDLVPVEPIVAIRYSINEDNRFKLVLETDQLLTIRKTTSSSFNGINDLVIAMDYQWHNEFVVKNENNESENILNDIVDQKVELEKDTVYKGELVKTPVSQNVNAYAEKLFKQGYKAYKSGDITSSLKILNKALDQDGSHVNARSTMATILSKQGHSELAYSILNEGLIQYPEQVEWLKVYARLLLNEGRVVEAKERLEQHAPALSVNVEFYALKAAILQKLNEHNQSAIIYRDLLQFNPAKSVWWMGLGISLESLKRYQDALYAYQKASTNSALANESRNFISQRITFLNNLIKDESS